MMQTIKTVAILSLAMIGSVARADLVTNLDFSDSALWSVSVSTFGSSGVSVADSGVKDGGATLRVDKSGGSGGVFVFAELIGSISTAGFENLSLTFTSSGVGGELEFDAEFADYGASAGDGFLITSSQGISFDTLNPNATFESQLDAGQTWTPADALAQGQDLAFDSTADNSAITILAIRMQVNANAEDLDLTGFSINGTAVQAIPEAGSVLFGTLVCGIMGFTYAGRRMRKVTPAADSQASTEA